MSYDKGEKLTVYNRPAHVKIEYPNFLLVQYEDNNTEGHIPKEHL
jgi:hypothetical protein